MIQKILHHITSAFSFAQKKIRIGLNGVNMEAER